MSVPVSPGFPLRSFLAACGLTLLLAATTRCDLAEPGAQESLVVEAFLKTGQPPPAIKLRSVQPHDDSIAPGDDAVTNASLAVRLGEATVPYAPVPGAPGRYAPQRDSLLVAPGTPFSLQATWNGEVATAEGAAPPPISVGEVCLEVPDDAVRAVLVDSVRRDSLDIPAEQGFIYPIDVTVSWAGTSAPDSTYFVRAQLQPSAQFSSRVVDFFLQPAEVRPEGQFRGAPLRRRWTGVYAVPVDSADDPLPEHRLTVALVRGDASFASFAASRTDPGRREPTSNVTGGLGIATAIALDSLRRRVAPGSPACFAP